MAIKESGSKHCAGHDSPALEVLRSKGANHFSTIAGGTPLYITTTGYNYKAASTTATLGNGTATCSGTAAIATKLGGAQGNVTNLVTALYTQVH